MNGGYQIPDFAPINGGEMSYRDPTKEDLSNPLFEVIWQEIKSWDINVPAQYSGYCGATGNHVCAILDALHEAKK